MDNRKVAAFWARKASKHAADAASNAALGWKVADEFARQNAIDAIEAARKCIAALDRVALGDQVVD